MYMYIYIYMYIQIHIYVYIYTYTCTYTYTYILRCRASIADEPGSCGLAQRHHCVEPGTYQKVNVCFTRYIHVHRCM